jgi:hypothetical protein
MKNLLYRIPKTCSFLLGLLIAFVFMMLLVDKVMRELDAYTNNLIMLILLILFEISMSIYIYLRFVRNIKLQALYFQPFSALSKLGLIYGIFGASIYSIFIQLLFLRFYFSK